MIDQKIRDFEFQSEIGSGGYGVVYRAHEESVNRDVAIKVILPQFTNQPEFMENFASEARLVATLEHPRIVPLYSFWHDEQGAFLVMRYIRGGSLREVLVKQGALPMNKVLQLVEQMSDALNVAHEAGIVHRDLKPDNILIDERGNAYLTDFGIAKQLDAGQSATNIIKGTLAYLSPEQIQQTPVSPQTDIYALGVMLFEMLTGQHPFHETPIGMMVMKHLQELLPNIRELREDLSVELNNIVEKATAKDIEQRYTSTTELVNDLRQTISGVAVTAPQPITISKKKPTSTEERNRHYMLENVGKFWVEGVLENSLHDAAMIDLGLRSESGVVDNPWDTLLRTPAGDEQITDSTIIEQFDRLNGKMLILGDPGSGKTTTLLMLARDLLSRAQLDEQHPIPVVFNLSSWSENQRPIAEWLVEELNGKYQVPRKVGAKWVEDDEILLLLDGLDEVAEAVRNDCVKAINDYRSEHGFVDVVVCSRIKDYEELAEQLKLNGAIIIQPLDDIQIVQYLDALSDDVAIVRQLIADDKQLRELAQSPLMLSIMVLAYRGKTTQDIPYFDDMEAKRGHLFDVYVQRMFDRYTGNKQYTETVTRRCLSWLAKRLKDHTQSILYIEEIQPDWLHDEAKKKGYAKIVGVVIFLMMWVMVSIALASTSFALAGQLDRYGIDSRLSDTIIIVLAVAASSVNAIPISIFNYRVTRSTPITPVETVRWTLKAVIRKMWNRFGESVLFGLVYAVFVGGVFTILFEVRAGIAIGLGLLIGNIILYAVASGFTTSYVDTKVRPNQGIWKSLYNTLQIGVNVPIIFCTTIGVFFLLAYDPIVALTVAFTLFIPMFLVGIVPDMSTIPGSIAVLQHITLRYLLQKEHQIPRNLAQFLDYTSSLILMRKVGGGYIFVHRYLLEYFAERDDEDTHQSV